MAADAVLGTAVLVHGTWGDPGDWFAVRPLLEAAGVRVETPDLVSHRSPAAGLLEDGELVRAAVTAAVTSGDLPVVLVGWSFGGDVVGLASRPPTPVTHLTYLSCTPRAAGTAGPGTDWIDDHPHLRRTTRGTFLLDEEWWLTQEAGTTFPPEVVARLRAHPRREASLRTETDAYPPGPPGWHDVPTTVVVGRDDPLVPEQDRHAARERCPDVRIVEGDHFLLWRSPGLVARTVLEGFAR